MYAYMYSKTPLACCMRVHACTHHMYERFRFLALYCLCIYVCMYLCTTMYVDTADSGCVLVNTELQFPQGR